VGKALFSKQVVLAGTRSCMPERSIMPAAILKLISAWFSRQLMRYKTGQVYLLLTPLRQVIAKSDRHP